MEQTEGLKPNSPMAIALGKAQAEFPIVAKDKTVKKKGKSKQGNDFEYSYKYADLTNVIEAIRGVLHKHELAFTQLPTFHGEKFVLVTRIWHSSGEEIVSIWPLAAMADLQDMGGQLTYVKRYALTAALGIAADEDVDGKPKEPEKEGKRNAPSAGAMYTLEGDMGEFSDHASATAFLDALERLLKVTDDQKMALERNSKPFQHIQARAAKAKMQNIVDRCSAIYKDVNTEPAQLNP